jgi:hypothetical protein
MYCSSALQTPPSAVPKLDLPGDANAECADVEIRDRRDSGFLGQNSFPKTFDAFADASDRA